MLPVPMTPPDPVSTVVLDALRSWPAPAALRVAFSGGLDSTVLLDVLERLLPGLGAPLTALHVNHGLHPASDEWARHCLAQCRQRRIPCTTLRLDGRPPRGGSTEAWARVRRYRVLSDALAPGDLLLTAHHRDDQAETLLLQLCRGAGPAGLAAMPAWRRLGAGAHGRPLLACGREALAEYAQTHGLRWIEDPSNDDAGYDRNFVRHSILPVLRRRWPAAGETLARAAALQAESRAVLEDIAAVDLAVCRGAAPGRLRLGRLQAWPWPRQANVLRHWFASLGLPPPARAHLLALRAQLGSLRPDTGLRVTWPGGELRVFGGELWAGPTPPARDGRTRIPWEPDGPCELAHGRLSATPVTGAGLRADAVRGRRVEVRFRAGGETLRPAGDGHRRELRKLLQQARVPPWLRDRLPLVYVGADLAAVADQWIADGYAARDGEAGWVLHWQDAATPAARRGDG
jgi:tRNA(Ile)-lysidine synthase